MYEFECNIEKLDTDVKFFDEWGAAYVWLNEDVGVEYNLCIDNGENFSAIYKMETHNGLLETDGSSFIHYEIDFSDEAWEEKLKIAMCDALKELHNVN